MSQQLYKIETSLRWTTDRKSYVAYRIAQISMTFNDLEGHFSSLKPF